MANITGFSVGGGVFAINGFCQYSGAGCLSYTSWTTKQKSMRKLLIPNSIFQCCGDM